MKIPRYIPLLIVVITMFAGCRTTQPGRTVEQPVDTIPVRLEELHGCAVLPESWIGENAVATAKKINSLMDTIAGANFNAVFFSFDDAGEHSAKWQEPGIDLLKVAVEAAHSRNLRIFFRFDPVRVALRDSIADLPRMKVYLKKLAVNLISDYDADGICFNLTDLSLQPFPSGALALAKYSADTLQFVRMPEITANPFIVDLFEDIMVEIMVFKPYLINSIIYTGDNAGLTAAKCLEEGIADLIFDLSQIETYNSETSLRGYPVRAEIPRNLKRAIPGQVVRLDLSALFLPDTEGQPVFFDQMKKFKMADTYGRIGFITPLADTIKFRIPSREVSLPTGYWTIPYSYKVMADNSVARQAPWVEFRRVPASYTNAPEFDLLCKTDYPSTVLINGEQVKQYKTGIFFRKVSFIEGFNRVRAEVITPDSLTAFYEMEYFYEKVDRTRKALPLWIDSRTVSPSTDNEMLPGDIVRVSFQGSLNQTGYVVLNPGGLSLKCTRVNYGDYSLYLADIPLSGLEPGTGYKIKLRLEPQPGDPGDMPLEYDMPNTITVRSPADFPLVRVRRENSRLIYNLGAPRLGGPIRSELGPGVVMKTNGKIGENYRIRLSRTEEGFIHQSEVEVLEQETVQPGYYVTSMSCGPSAGADILSIPYLEPVPYEVYPDPDQKRITVTLFGAESSSTWITHRQGRKIIDKITWQQTTPETFQVYINLNTSVLWGYDVKVEGSRLVVRIKYPPVYNLGSDKPLTGLKIAIEAGHGGSNTGAVGLSGLLEKDINLDLSLRLAALLSTMGAEIVQVRETDIDMSLTEKRDIAVRSGAHMLISIHANAGGTGYLQVAGTSTYWHNPFWAPLATTIYDRLLELGLVEFGVVGSFNYTVTRVTQMPSVLVEQAFMSHAEDEEKMADPEFRQQMAEKIYAGIIDYLASIK